VNTIINFPITSTTENSKEFFEVNKNISNLDEFNNFNISSTILDGQDYFNENFNSENKNESGVLSYDEVRDIIVYYDMGEIERKEDFLFEKNDFEEFVKNKKKKIEKFFFDENLNKIKLVNNFKNFVFINKK
jgi:hypothetical protein